MGALGGTKNTCRGRCVPLKEQKNAGHQIRAQVSVLAPPPRDLGPSLPPQPSGNQLPPLKGGVRALASVAPLDEALSHSPNSHGFNSRSERMPRLRFQSPIGAHARGNSWMFLSHILCFSSSSFSLPLSLKSISMSPDEDFFLSGGGVYS